MLFANRYLRLRRIRSLQFLVDNSSHYSPLDQQTRAFALRYSDRRYESVTHLGNGLNILMLAVVIAERFADRPDVPRQVYLFDKGVRPDLGHEFVFSN